jgi:hypothetical protein
VVSLSREDFEKVKLVLLDSIKKCRAITNPSPAEELCMIFEVPPRMLPWSTLTGLAGWVALNALKETGAASAGPYLGAVAVGVVSIVFGLMMARMPFSVAENFRRRTRQARAAPTS